jgi:hypothetical protein
MPRLIVTPTRDNIMTVSCHYGRVQRQQLEEQEVGVRSPSVCEDMSPKTEECPLLEDVKSRAAKTVLSTLVCV